VRATIVNTLAWAGIGEVKVLPSLEDEEIARISQALLG
jgi:hypothetical protein